MKCRFCERTTDILNTSFGSLCQRHYAQLYIKPTEASLRPAPVFAYNGDVVMPTASASNRNSQHTQPGRPAT